MPYRQYTKCVQKGGENTYAEIMFAYFFGGTILVGLVGFFTTGDWVGVVVGAITGGATALMAGFCRWFFYERLVCIEKDQILVGLVDKTSIADDGDLCFYVIPAPHGIGASLTDMQTQPPQDKFMRPHFLDLPFHQEKQEGASNTVCLQCEIEGSRMKTICAGTIAGSTIGTAAALTFLGGCVLTGILSWLCALVALIVWAIITGIGYLIGKAAGEDGSFKDVAAQPGSGRLTLGECIVVKGDWIYDSGHEGWHEIHPVKEIYKTGIAPLDIPGLDIKGGCKGMSLWMYQQIIDKIKEKDNPDTWDKQGEWENQWVTHRTLG